jgi:hypothetical protein
MAATILSLALALGAFLWVLSPLFGDPAPIPQARPEDEARMALSRSLQELRTDLDLQKIQAEDLKEIQQHLEEEASR